MAAGNAEGDAVTSGDFTAYSVDFTQASNSETKLGVKIVAEGTNEATGMAITGPETPSKEVNFSYCNYRFYGFYNICKSYALDLSMMVLHLQVKLLLFMLLRLRMLAV